MTDTRLWPSTNTGCFRSVKAYQTRPNYCGNAVVCHCQDDKRIIACDVNGCRCVRFVVCTRVRLNECQFILTHAYFSEHNRRRYTYTVCIHIYVCYLGHWGRFSCLFDKSSGNKECFASLTLLQYVNCYVLIIYRIDLI